MKKIIKLIVKIIILAFAIFVFLGIFGFFIITEDLPFFKRTGQTVAKTVSGLPIPSTAKVLKFDDYSSLNGNSYSYVVINLNDSQFKKILLKVKHDPMFERLPLKGKDIRSAPRLSKNGYYMAKVIGKDNQYIEVTNGYYTAEVDQKNLATFRVIALDIESQNIYIHLSIN